MDFDKLTALLDMFANGEVSRPNMLAQIKLHADERVAAESERCVAAVRAQMRDEGIQDNAPLMNAVQAIRA